MQGDYDSGTYAGYWAGQHVGSILNDYIEINWGGGSPSTQDVDIKILSRDNSGYWTSTMSVSGDCGSSDGCVDSTISEMGDNSSSTWTTGVTHDYDNGTYVVYWNDSARAPVVNKEDNYNDSGSGNTGMGNSNRWRNEQW